MLEEHILIVYSFALLQYFWLFFLNLDLPFSSQLWKFAPSQSVYGLGVLQFTDRLANLQNSKTRGIQNSIINDAIFTMPFCL